MTYKLKYKLPGQWFWRRLRGVTHNFVENGVWVIVFANGRQMILPLTTCITAGKERHEKIKADMEREARQPLVTDPGGNAR